MVSMTRIKEFTLPDLGEGLTEGEILRWLVGVGDTIELNQPIVEVETAKAAVEIPAKWGGRVEAIFHEEGAIVEVGTAIIAIDTQPDAPPESGPGRQEATAASAPASSEIAAGKIGGEAPGGRTAVLVGYGPRTAAAKRRPRKILPPEPLLTSEPSEPSAEPAEDATTNGAVARDAAPDGETVLAKPPVRKLARDLGVDLHTITGTGPEGSITRDDVQAAVGGSLAQVGGGAAVAVPAKAGSTTTAPAAGRFWAASTEPSAPGVGPDREQRIPIKGVRKLTAENMVASAFTAPHVTEFLTVDMTRSMKALDRLRAMPEWREMRVSPLLLVAKAALLAIRRHPMVNSTWSGDTNEIVIKEYVNLGIAAATERGLIVPNIKDAGRLSLRELADAMTGLVQTAKAGRTAPADMSGGSFTITNVGVFGVDSGTPILPPGETAILAFGAVRDMPWVHKGKIRVRKVTTLALSFDHRIVDGELGSLFLSDIGRFLADPEAALLAWG
jgi:pyruvate dehydrogenase E2 component (dihydrolipoamide acetyltransferase)